MGPLGIDLPPGEAPARARALEADGYSIHFHTFTLTSFLSLVLHCREAYGLPLEVLAAETNDHEFIVIAQRIARVSPIGANALASSASAAGITA